MLEELPELILSGEPLHDRLASTLAQAIASGSLAAGDRLPPHRALCRRYRVGIGTVTRAMDALTMRGLVRGEVGRGTFVLGTGETATARIVADLSVNSPLSVVPPAVLASAASRAARLSAALPQAGYGGDVRGFPQHREVLARWLSGDRVRCEPEELIVTVGAQHALDLSFRDAVGSGGTVLTESATFSGALAITRSATIRMEPVPTDDQGMVPSALDVKLGATSAKAIYTTPVCHNPLTFSTGRQRRHEIVEICRRHGAVIIEDDVYGIYGDPTIPTYKAMAPDIVYFCSSLSKCLTPLLRVGLLLPPPTRRDQITTHLRANLWSAPALAVATACELIETGVERAAGRLLREEARSRMALAERYLGSSTIVARPGPHLWLPMSADRVEGLLRGAVEEGVKLTPPSAYQLDPRSNTGIRVCLMSTSSRGELERGLKALTRLLAKPSRHLV